MFDFPRKMTDFFLHANGKLSWFPAVYRRVLVLITRLHESRGIFLLMARLKTTAEMYFANMNCLQSSIFVRSF